MANESKALDLTTLANTYVTPTASAQAQGQAQCIPCSSKLDPLEDSIRNANATVNKIRKIVKHNVLVKTDRLAVFTQMDMSDENARARTIRNLEMKLAQKKEENQERAERLEKLRKEVEQLRANIRQGLIEKQRGKL